MLIAAGVGLAVSALSCSSSHAARVETPVDLAIAPLSASAHDGGIETTGKRSPSERCTLELRTTVLHKSQPQCYLDEEISKGTGELEYPCDGYGTAEARFGKQRYVGEMKQGAIELKLSTELDWEDSCRWGTDAVITGAILNGRNVPTLQPIAWSYSDRVISGTNCSGLCTARASFVVTRPKANQQIDLDDDNDDDGD